MPNPLVSTETERAAQIRYAIIARVLRGIERAAQFQEREACHRTYELLGSLQYLHYESGVCSPLDECVEQLEANNA